MELNGLMFVGAGLITDPETGVQERIELNVDQDLCQLIIKLDTEVESENVYPKLELKDVAFTMDQKSFVINTQGDLPIYKSHKFEEGIKTWITNELT